MSSGVGPRRRVQTTANSQLAVIKTRHGTVQHTSDIVDLTLQEVRTLGYRTFTKDGKGQSELVERLC